MILFSLESCFTQKQIINLILNYEGIQHICVSRPINVKYDPNKPNEVMVQATLANTNDVDVTGRLWLQAYVFDKNDQIIGMSQSYFQTPIVVFPKNKTNAYTSDFFKISIYTTPIQVGQTYKFQIRLYNPVNSPSQDNPFTSCTLYNEFIMIN